VTGRVLLFAVAVALVAAGVAGAVTSLPGFRSPSGNISCLLVPGPPRNVQCQIAHAGYAKTLQARCMGPAQNGVDWRGFTLTATKPATLVCSGGILYNPTAYRPRYVTLPYGKSWRQGMFTCVSRVAGVTCTSHAGHGLFVSRQSWRAW
jgi:hypothetical protein